ncbi:hypothetical protein OPKNFCMD_1016 [Methylobacterium crusticola]|uniref:Sulfatase N-terminal domain-containing protein n=1 Tax=Methylobacterium crusticola TaxID=1697972 RepID=A0ABQ4QST7_9HYPH|nr:hypothetical protein [Methylobacterium crusticola]GJD48299.1 hypothetical protein OPKNFCMD_1016 [Methylobacterium crusticola]
MIQTARHPIVRLTVAGLLLTASVAAAEGFRGAPAAGPTSPASGLAGSAKPYADRVPPTAFAPDSRDLVLVTLEDLLFDPAALAEAGAPARQARRGRRDCGTRPDGDARCVAGLLPGTVPGVEPAPGPGTVEERPAPGVSRLVRAPGKFAEAAPLRTLR